MALHEDKNSMMKEVLQEYLEVAEYCVLFDKSRDVRWINTAGCYGYPAGLLLLSITDAIGTEIMGGGDDVIKHFNILNHKDFYDLNLNQEELEALRKEYRNRLSHNAHIGENVFLDIGTETSSVFESFGSVYKLNLLPFLILSKRVVGKFKARDASGG